MKAWNTGLIGALTGALLLTACGGGGGGGGSSGSGSSAGSTSVAPTSTITASNQDQLAYAVVQSTSSAVTASGTDNSYGAVSVETSSTSTLESVPGIHALVVQQIRAYQASLPTKSGLLGTQLSTTADETTSCSGGGTKTTTTSASGLDVTFTFSACITSGVTMNGVIAAHFDNLSSSGGSGSFSYKNLKTSYGSLISTTYNGSESISYTLGAAYFTYTANNGNFTVNFVANSLSGTLNLSNLSAKTVGSISSGDQTTLPLQMDVTTVIKNASFGVRVEAITALESNGTGSSLRGGKLKVTGKTGILYVSFLGAGIVKLELDSNSDGIVDATKTTSFSLLGTAAAL